MGEFKLSVDILVVDHELYASVCYVDIFFLGISITAQAVMDIDSYVGAHKLDNGLFLDTANSKSMLTCILDLDACVKGTKFRLSFKGTENQFPCVRLNR